MGTYDVKRLEVAIQYIRRMAEGRNPVTNRPAPDNEVLTNVNVNRCLKFVGDILSDVHRAGGAAGPVPGRTAAEKPPLSKVFPYDVLKNFQYVQDQQISYFLNQIRDLVPEEQRMPIKATVITDWLRQEGYLIKQTMPDIHKEVSVPGEKGRNLGLYAEKAGSYPNEYYRVYYNEAAQRFIADNFQRILTESEAIREKLKKERRSAPGKSRAAGSAAPAGPGSAASKGSASSPAVRSGASEKSSASGRSVINEPVYVDDPAFSSLVASLSSSQSEDVSGPDYDPLDYDMPEDGWKKMDEGLPW